MVSDFNLTTGQLFINVPATGFVNTGFTVVVSGDTASPLLHSAVAISKASGPGTMNGTLVLNDVSGIAVFNNISFDATGDYRITANANGLTVTSDVISIYQTSAPTKLAITNVNVCDTNGTIPINSNFDVTVQALFSNNTPANVSSDLSVTLDLLSGTGLSGNTNGTILTGTNTVTISGVKLTSLQSGVILRASGGSLAPGLSRSFSIVSGPHHLGFVNFPSTGYKNSPLQIFEIRFYNSDNSLNLCYNGLVSLTQYTPYSPVFLSGTTTVNAHGGIAYFNNIYFTMQGTYTLRATSTDLQDGISGSVLITQGTPEITSTILPMYMQGNSSYNNGHTPFIFLAKIRYLAPNTTYKYYNKVVDNSIGSTDPGVGNVLFANSNGTFTRTDSPNFSTTGHYAEFTTDEYGNYSGWFISETNTSTVFSPGNTVQMRISLDCGFGAPIMLTTSESAKILDYTATLAITNRCSFMDQTIVQNTGTQLMPGNMLLFYTNSDSSVSTRPVSGTFIESDGLSLTGLPYHPQYLSSIDGYNQRWGTIIPCDLPGGITKIEERNLSGNKSGNSLNSMTGAIRCTATSPNGVWLPGVNTRNTTGGSTILSIQPAFTTTEVRINSDGISNGFKLLQNYPNPFNPTTNIRYKIANNSFVSLKIYNVLGKEAATLVNENLQAGTYNVNWNASNLASGIYYYKLTAGNYTEVKKAILLK